MTDCKKTVWPDYKNCLANLPNSILKNWGIPTVGKSLPLADKYLDKNYKNVVVILLDGMGALIAENLLNKSGAFLSHLAGIYKSVFPATTVSATTSAMSGLQPCEHSWLGWDCYYPQIDKNVTVFLNTIQGTNTQAADYHVAWTLTPYDNIVTLINNAGGKAYGCAPFLAPYPKNLEEICKQIKALCEQPDRKYIYAYWHQPDELLHRYGCNSNIVKEALKDIENTISKLADEVKDTLIIVTADHGHIDTKHVLLKDYPKICDCLVRMPSLESRALNFFVKKEKKNIFEQEFKKEFSDKFSLLTMDEALERNLFGTGKYHKTFRAMLGDYIAIATDDLSIYFNNEKCVSMHGSITENEMLIPLIVFEK